MRILITGGGTGGHTSPAVAVYEELLKRDSRLSVLWIGRGDSIEERVCATLGIPFRSLPVEGWPRRNMPRRLWVAGKMGWCLLRAWGHIRAFQPQLAFGVGGYVSLPAMYVAQRLGIPTVIHEQNRLLGVANRILAGRATRILLSYSETAHDLPPAKVRVVGNPVRAAFAEPPDRLEARNRFSLDPEIPTVLITGGSQGARTINDAMAGAVERFERNEAQFIWLTGQSDAARGRTAAAGSAAKVQVFPFLDDMAAAFAASDLIVSRAGASSTAEIAIMRKPSVLVPFPFATDNHQEFNARAFGDAGAAIVLLDRECSADRLTALLRELLSSPAQLANMARAAASLARPAAAEAIAEEILSLVFECRGQGSVPGLD